jgi:hypothetical protein
LAEEGTVVGITICVNDTCPQREQCYRYIAEPGERQSFSMFTPDENGECENFLEIWEDSSDEV